MASESPTPENRGLPEQPTPVLSLRDVVVYPFMVIPLFVGRERSVQALDRAMTVDKQILLVTQKSPETEEPGADDLYTFGTVASILQMLRLPDGTTKVLVEGVRRVRIEGYEDNGEFLTAEWQAVEESEGEGARERVPARETLGNV